MKCLSISLACFVAPFIAAQSLSPKESMEAERTSLHAAYQQPWHRVVQFQIFDRQAKPISTGTIEDLYESSTLQKRVITEGSNAPYVNYTTASGTVSDKKNAWVAPALLIALNGLGENLVPVVMPRDKFLPEKPLQHSALDCYGTERLDESGIYAVSMSETPAICFSPKSRLVRAVRNEGIVTAITARMPFRGSLIPKTVAVLTDEGKVAELTVTTLEPLNAPIQPPDTSLHMYPARGSELAACEQGGLRPAGLPHSQKAQVKVFIHVNAKGKADGVDVLSRVDALVSDSIRSDEKKKSYSPCIVDGHPTDFSFMTSIYRPEVMQVTTGGFLAGWNSYLGPGAYDSSSLSSLPVAGW